MIALPMPVLINVVSSDLSDDEQEIANALTSRLWQERFFLGKHAAYYDGEQRVRHLGIAIPPQLMDLHTVIGWPRLAVDILDERLDVQGFRRHDTNASDAQLWDWWLANGMDHESELAHLDALIFGRSFAMVGSNPDGDHPLITVESPMNLSCHWDAVTRQVSEAFQWYWMDRQQCAALYLKDQTIHLTTSGYGDGWQVFARDQHNLGRTPVVMLANRQRSHDRYGRSEITPEVMSITDAAVRTMLGMEVAREFFGTPQRYILGATEEAFQDAEGNPKTAWETYIGRVLALERDEDGNLPSVGQFASGDPTAYTNILMMYSRFMAAVTGMPPHLLGFSADNPVSAEGIRSAEARLDKRALRKQNGFGLAWRDVQRIAQQIQNGGVEPDDAKLIDVQWADPSTPTPAETTTAMLQQVQMGYMPPSSDVLGQRLGYSASERQRIDEERKEMQSADQLDAIAASITGMSRRYRSEITGQGGNAAVGIDQEGGDVPLKGRGAPGGGVQQNAKGSVNVKSATGGAASGGR